MRFFSRRFGRKSVIFLLLNKKHAMNGAPKDGRLVRFSLFELDLDSGELFRQGRKVKLQGQPFELLIALLERPGMVVTREELRQRVWPSDTAGDFDHGLNRAINKVREALGDSAESPRFIETLPRRGYRFIGSIQEEVITEQREGPPLIQMPVQRPDQVAKRNSKKTSLAIGAVMGGVFVASLVIWMALQKPAARSEVRIQQLTTNSAENPIWHAVISPDGKYAAYGDVAGIQIRVISTGESHLLPRPPSLKQGDAWFPAAWLPDGTRILATSITSTASSAWMVSVIGGAATPIRDNAHVQSVSPDGLLIAFTSSRDMESPENAINRRLIWNSEIWIMGPDGENASRLVSGDNLTYFGSVRWSPDGNRIAYQKYRSESGDLVDYMIESCDRNGGPPSVILSKRHYAAPSIDHSFPEDFCWLSDGRVIYAVREPAPNSRDSNLWAVAVDAKSGKPERQPRRITNLAGFHMEGLSVAADGRKLTFETSSDQSYVYVGRLEADGKLGSLQRLTPDERYNTPSAWTPDSKAVIFRSDRTGTFAIYKQALDQDVPELIPTGSGNPSFPRVSPDGTWLIYAVLPNTDSRSEYRLMRAPLAGGLSQVIFERTKFVNFGCPDRLGSQCVISESSSDGKQDMLSSFDAVSGTRHELFRIARKPVNCMVSPDGSRIAMVGNDPEGRIEIRALTGQIESKIQVNGWPRPFNVDWAADGKSLFVSHPGLMGSPSGPIGTTLLRVDLQGNVQPLWETRGARYTWGIPSPDGKYLAIRGATTERNAWVVENF
jgi:eukaryotic-like serine/threonine-protein kinase